MFVVSISKAGKIAGRNRLAALPIYNRDRLAELPTEFTNLVKRSYKSSYLFASDPPKLRLFHVTV